MEYLKVWTSFRTIMSQLKDDEKGRLFDAMLVYAETGEEPQVFVGNEFIIWPTAKLNIDQTAKRCEQLKENASKGGIAKSKNQQALANDSKSYQTAAKNSNNNQHKAKETELAEKFDQFWSAYPRHQDKKKAQDAFRAINPDEELLAKMLASIEKQKASSQWQEAGGKFVPHPTTWLHGKRWEDEVQQDTGTWKPQKQSTLLPAQQYSQRDYSEPMETAEEWMLRMMAEEEAKKAGTA